MIMMADVAVPESYTSSVILGKLLLFLSFIFFVCNTAANNIFLTCWLVN